MVRVSSLRCLIATAFVAGSFLGAPAYAETPAERGEYLVESIVACGNCHTPRGMDGQQIMEAAYAGGLLLKTPEMTVFPPNITPDMKTGIGGWTDDEIKTAITQGKRPDGTVLGPPMPFEWYALLADEDLDAIVAYLRTVPPVENAVPKSSFAFPLPPAWPAAPVPAPEGASDQVKRGFYLAGPLGHCLECHTPFKEPGHRDYENRLGAGGFEIDGPWGLVVSANITPHPDDGIAKYTDAEIKKIVSTGMRPDGTALTPPMAIPYYAKMTDADLDALAAYLRTLPPVPSE